MDTNSDKSKVQRRQRQGAQQASAQASQPLQIAALALGPQGPAVSAPQSQWPAISASRPQRPTASVARPRHTENPRPRSQHLAAPLPRTQESATQRLVLLPTEEQRALFDEPFVGGIRLPQARSITTDLDQNGVVSLDRASASGSMSFSSASQFGLTTQPSDASSHGEPDTPSKGRGLDAKVPKNSIGIGIETEFFLDDKPERKDPGPDPDPRRQRSDAGDFCWQVRDLYNEQVPLSYPRMDSIYERDCVRWETDRHDMWILMRESTIHTHEPPCNYYYPFKEMRGNKILTNHIQGALR